jgi:spermidine synthase
VKPTILLDRALSPDGQELTLHQRDDTFVIRIAGDDLMSSRMHGSEEELARLAVEARGTKPIRQVVVGGLGMGYTLRALLGALDAAGVQTGVDVVVAELFPEVVRWNQGPLAPLAGHPLADRRVRVALGDAVDLLLGPGTPPGVLDVVMLDLDNSPNAFTVARNARLYSRRGLARLRERLSSGGVLAVWSAHDDPAFVERLRAAGYRPSVRRVPARAGGPGGRGKGGLHVLFVAVREEAAVAPGTGRPGPAGPRKPAPRKPGLRKPSPRRDPPRGQRGK